MKITIWFNRTHNDNGIYNGYPYTTSTVGGGVLVPTSVYAVELDVDAWELDKQNNLNLYTVDPETRERMLADYIPSHLIATIETDKSYFKAKRIADEAARLLHDDRSNQYLTLGALRETFAEFAALDVAACEVANSVAKAARLQTCIKDGE